MVVLMKEELQPTETLYRSPAGSISTRWVLENQVEKIAPETETFMVSKVSCQRETVSRVVILEAD